MRIRGFRIDTAVVEAMLTRAPGVGQAFADARAARRGDTRLVGYLVPSPGADIDLAAVRSYVRDRLPEYTVPSALVALDAFPLEPNGRLSRQRLPTPDFTPAAVSPPRTPGEQVLCSLFAEILGLPDAGIDDDFFDLGGTERQATELARRVTAELHTDMRPDLLSRAPTVAGLGQLLGVGRPVRPPLDPSRWRSKVKINGRAIAPCEAAASVMAAPGVRQAAVIVREDRPGERVLVAYLVPNDDFSFDLGAVREYLGGQLPDYMTPSELVLLDSIPLTDQGDLDRRALPAPDYGLTPAGLRRAVRTPGEELLCGLFSEVLDVAEVGVDEDFFELGGNSLLAIRLTNRMRAAFGVPLEVKAVFEDPTVAALACRMSSEASPEDTPAQPGGRQ